MVFPGAIRDCFRLGKYTPQLKRPRPLLVMLNRTADVRTVLSNRSSVPTPYRIKPDLSPEEREVDTIFLKHRWSFIQSGVDRKDIKLSTNCLYVKHALYGVVKDSMFITKETNRSSAQNENQRILDVPESADIQVASTADTLLQQLVASPSDDSSSTQSTPDNQSTDVNVHSVD